MPGSPDQTRATWVYCGHLEVLAVTLEEGTTKESGSDSGCLRSTGATRSYVGRPPRRGSRGNPHQNVAAWGHWGCAGLLLGPLRGGIPRNPNETVVIWS
jgi:hypothetical protein